MHFWYQVFLKFKFKIWFDYSTIKSTKKFTDKGSEIVILTQIDVIKFKWLK